MKFETMTNQELMSYIVRAEAEEDRARLVYGEYEHVVPSMNYMQALKTAVERGIAL